MKKAILAVVIAAAAIGVVSTNSDKLNPDNYFVTGEIQNGNQVILEDGNIWEDERCSEFSNGTIVNVCFNTVGTVGIYDDVIVSITK